MIEERAQSDFGCALFHQACCQPIGIKLPYNSSLNK